MEQDNRIRDFTDLIVWQRAHVLVMSVYSVSKEFPDEERFALTDQTRRAAVSITSNIAEGFGRRSTKDKSHFYNIALASLYEVRNQLIVARDLKYIDPNVYKDVYHHAMDAQKVLAAFIKSTKEMS